MWVTVVALAAAAAPNGHLAQARAEIAALHYDKAEEELRAGLAAPGNDRPTLLALLSLTGEVEAIVGKSEASTSAFKELLYLAPDTVPNPTWSPKVAGHFMEARAWLNGAAPLAADVLEPVISSGRVKAVTLHIHDDALHLATSLRVSTGGDPTETPIAADGKVVASVPAAAAVTWWAEVLGPQGAVLLRVGDAQNPQLAEVPAALLARPAPAVADHAGLRPVAYGAGGAGVLLLGGSAFFALGAGSDRSKLSGATHDAQGRVTSLSQKDAYALYAEGNSRATTSVVLGVAGAVALAAGAGLWFYTRPVAVLPSATGVALAGSFP